MKEHGFTTSRAQYWVHIHPLERAVFFYKTADLRNFAARHWLTTKLAAPYGVVTGAGLLVRKSAFFVSRQWVPRDELEGIRWQDLTDREKKKPSEHIVMSMFARGLLVLPEMKARPLAVQPAKTIEEQYHGIDCWLLFEGYKISVEIKCDTHSDTGNLFVQVAEGGHDVHVTRDGIRRVTELC